MAEAKSRREPNGARSRARIRPDLPGGDPGVAPVNDAHPEKIPVQVQDALERWKVI